MPVNHSNSSLTCHKILIVCRPKEDTKLEKSENPTSGLSQSENEIRANGESSSGPFFLRPLLHLPTMYKSRSPVMYHSIENVRYCTTGLFQMRDKSPHHPYSVHPLLSASQAAPISPPRFFQPYGSTRRLKPHLHFHFLYNFKSLPRRRLAGACVICKYP
jgi:hypothetical protein